MKNKLSWKSHGMESMLPPAGVATSQANVIPAKLSREMSSEFYWIPDNSTRG